MTIRSAILIIALGLPAVLLLAFGPRGRHDAPEGRTIIRYWEKWSGVEGLAMQRIVDEFNDGPGAEAGIWVDYNAISNVDQRTLIAAAGGDPPDLAGLYDFVLPQFADQGALLPLDDLVTEFGIDQSQFKPVWWSIGQYDGRLYGLPSAPYTIALFYNKRLFREAGLDPEKPPRTIAELDEYTRRLTLKADDGRIVQMGFTVAPRMLGWWHWVWPQFFYADLWDGRAFHLDTPEGLAAFTWIDNIRTEIGRTASGNFEMTAAVIEGAENPFLNERLAMMYQGPWIVNWINKYTPSLEYGVAAFPGVTAERTPVLVSSDVYVIPKGAPHAREAMTFLAYLMRQDVMERLCREHGKVSPFREPGAAFYTGHPNQHIRLFDGLADSPYAFGYPKMPTFKEASMEMLVVLEDLLQGKRTPGEAAAIAQASIDDDVSEYQRVRAKRYGTEP
jgi:ABC-type glycerol-3-phosphate transport system substrate-binding protein